MIISPITWGQNLEYQNMGIRMKPNSSQSSASTSSNPRKSSQSATRSFTRFSNAFSARICSDAHTRPSTELYSVENIAFSLRPRSTPWACQPISPLDQADWPVTSTMFVCRWCSTRPREGPRSKGPSYDLSSMGLSGIDPSSAERVFLL